MVRIGLVVADALSAHLWDGTHPDGPLTAWDGHWYLWVATNWYPATAPTAGGHLTYVANGGFEPLFPALIRATQIVGLTAVQAAVVVSIIAGVVSVVLVWRLGTVLFDQQVGSIAATLFVVFPGMAVAWGMTYSECVGLPLVAALLLVMVHKALVLGRRGRGARHRDEPDGVAAHLGGGDASRPDAPPAHGYRVRSSRWSSSRWVSSPTSGSSGSAITISCTGGICSTRRGGPRSTSGDHCSSCWSTPGPVATRGGAGIEWVGLLTVVAAVVAMVRAKLPLFITGYCIASFGLMFVSNSLGFKPRFLVWAFPALIAVAAVDAETGVAADRPHLRLHAATRLPGVRVPWAIYMMSSSALSPCCRIGPGGSRYFQRKTSGAAKSASAGA